MSQGSQIDGDESPRWRRGRVTIFAGACLLMGGAIWLLNRGGPQAMPWTCLLHEVTGLHCPGCGMTRATDALMNGEVLAAIRFNPLGVFLLPIALVALIPELVGWLRGTPPPWRMPIGKRGAWILVWIVITFAVLRNVPVAPFEWLAPSG